MSTITTLPSNQFKEIVENSKCYSDICRVLGLRKQGGYYRTIQRRIKRENISIDHFLPTSVLLSKNNNFHWISKNDFLENLKNGHNYCEDTLKHKIIEFDLIPHQCSECSLKHIWNNKKLILQLDHIDGNHTNNQISNLRWLCPNCHSQTETFCGKHKKTKSKIKIKKGLNLIKDRHIKISNRPSKEELLSVLGKLSFKELGRKYKVSDNGIRKWCKYYSLPYRKKDLVGNVGIEPTKEVCNTSSLPLA